MIDIWMNNNRKCYYCDNGFEANDSFDRSLDQLI